MKRITKRHHKIEGENDKDNDNDDDDDDDNDDDGGWNANREAAWKMERLSHEK